MEINQNSKKSFSKLAIVSPVLVLLFFLGNFLALQRGGTPLDMFFERWMPAFPILIIIFSVIAIINASNHQLKGKWIAIITLIIGVILMILISYAFSGG